jgi:hypothetical protein
VTTTQIDSGRFDASHVAFYLGGTVALGACTWLLGDSWATYGPGWGLALLVGYAAAFAAGSWWLLRHGWRVPGGLLATLVVGLVPAIVFAFEKVTGLWPDRTFGDYDDFYVWISSSWFAMELATIAAGLLVIRLVRFPFLVAPMAFAAWFASMDAAEVVFGNDPTAEQGMAVSLAFGAALIGVGTWLDRRSARPFAFWCHLFGLLSLQGALCALAVDHGSAGLAVIGIVGLVEIVVAVLLQRRTYLVFGGLGVFSWTCYLAHEVFSGTPLFPVALAAIGLAIIGGGIALERRRPATPVADGGVGYGVGTVGSR